MASAINRIFLAATVGEDPRLHARGARGERRGAGEGGAPRAAGMPGIGLMGGPQYFFRADPKGVIDKIDPGS